MIPGADSAAIYAAPERFDDAGLDVKLEFLVVFRHEKHPKDRIGVQLYGVTSK